MKYRLVTITEKDRLPASGDPHDYFSMAPYFWPDPDTEDGLPYVNRDGLVNPERYGRDREWLQEMIWDIKDCAERYEQGEKEAEVDAEALIRCFFLDPKTAMNPNLIHAQAIPGITDGRGIGIIDLNDFPVLFDSLSVFPERGWKEELRVWVRKFLDWFLHSDHGRQECAMENNHGAWYDVIAASMADFLGEEELLHDLLTHFIEKRVTKQLVQDGSMPLEMARTKPLAYHIFTLYAWARMATYGEKRGINLKDTEELQRAWRFLCPALHGEPFVKPDIVWPLDEECPPRIAFILKTFESA